MRLEEFWRLTPWEFNSQVAGFNWRDDRELDRFKFIAQVFGWKPPAAEATMSREQYLAHQEMAKKVWQKLEASRKGNNDA